MTDDALHKQAVPTRFDRQKIRLILILGGLSALGPLSIDMYLPAFPNMAASFESPLSLVEASLASYFVGLSFGQLFYGPLADRFGRKPLLLLGLFIYAVSSVLCAVVDDVTGLIALRFFQAFGACAGMAISRAVVRDQFGSQESARVFSLLMLVMGIAPILAPLLGGYVAKELGWRAIFWFLAMFSASCLAAVAALLPETNRTIGSSAIRPKAVLAIYGGLLRNREFLRFALAGAVVQAGMFAYITGAPFVFIEHFGIPAEHFGWVFGANALGLVAMTRVNAHLLRVHGYEHILPWSFKLLAAFGTLLGLAGLSGAGFWAVAVPLFLYVAMLGMTFPNTSAGALAKQGHHAGSASAMLGTIQMLVAALISTLVSVIGAQSAAPMTLTIAVCGWIGLVLFKLL